MSPLTTKLHIGKSLWTYRYSLAHNWKTHDVICKNRKFVTYLNIARAEDWRDENLVKFGNAVSEICIGTDRDIQTDIHCYTERLIILLSFQKRTNERFNAVAIITGIFSQISQDILDRLLQSLHHMKALCTLFSYLSGDIAMAINWFSENVMNADWYHLHSSHYHSNNSCIVTV